MASAAAQRELAAGHHRSESSRASSGYHDWYLRMSQQMLRDAPEQDRAPWRAQDDEACVELCGDVKDGAGDMAPVDVPDQAVRMHSSVAQHRDDLIDLTPAVGSAVLGHHRSKPRDGRLPHVQDDDHIRAVAGQVPGGVDCASAMRYLLGSSEIYGQQDIRLRIPGHRGPPALWC
jgi:hypothetical protein